MEKFILPILLLITSSCSSTATPEAGEARRNKEFPLAPRSSRPILPHAYWPLDYTVQRHQTTVPGPSHYRVAVVTKCLNDSAVVNQVTSDKGPALDVSHNYESILSVYREAGVWQQARLTKQLFKHDALAQKLGLLSTLALSHTAFEKYKAPDFYFVTQLGVPDSDIFIEGEIALTPNKGIRLVKVREQ